MDGCYVICCVDVRLLSCFALLVVMHCLSCMNELYNIERVVAGYCYGHEMLLSLCMVNVGSCCFECNVDVYVANGYVWFDVHSDFA